MHTFEFDQLETCNLLQLTFPEGRHYVTSDGLKLDSVTTILSERLGSKEAIAKWRERVGDEAADRVMVQAQRRGTAVHDAIEKFIYGDEKWKLKLMPVNKETVNNITPHLIENVNLVYGLEHRLYSTKLKAAGTADMICQWNGVNTIVDFKTSKRIKQEKDIESYFLQSAAYAYMMKERFDMDFPQIVIVMAIDNEPTRIFQKNAADFMDRLFEVFEVQAIDITEETR